MFYHVSVLFVYNNLWQNFPKERLVHRNSAFHNCIMVTITDMFLFFVV